MSSTYTANPLNQAPIATLQVTIPSDGDALAVASVNPALQAMADMLAARHCRGFGGIDSGASWVLSTGVPLEVSTFNSSSSFGTGITPNTGTGRITVSTAGIYRVEVYTSMLFSVATTPLFIMIRQNGVSNTIEVKGVNPNANAVPMFTAEYFQAAANDFFSLYITASGNGTASFYRGGLSVTRVS